MEKIIILYLMFFHNISIAQNLSTIQTDRPDQTECPFIVPENYFQFENGFSYEKINSNSHEIVAPAILTKFGIHNHFELRLIIEYVAAQNDFNVVSGFKPIYIGFKTRIFKENGIVPTTSFIGHISIPKLATNRFQTTYYAPEFRFTMQHTVSAKQTISYNIGAEWNGETPTTTFVYTLTTGYSLTERIGCYIEIYGFIPQNQHPDHRLDGGFTYLLNQNHQLDFSGGIGCSKVSPEYYFSIGYSFRIKV
jgi:hypothetical protein